MKTLVRLLAALLMTLAAAPTSAQQTTGTITGLVLDPQGMAVPGTTVTATNAATGFSRTDVSDSEGLYHLNAMPVGTYDVVAELPGFIRLERKNIAVDVSETTAAQRPAVRQSRGDGARRGSRLPLGSDEGDGIRAADQRRQRPQRRLRRRRRRQQRRHHRRSRADVSARGDSAVQRDDAALRRAVRPRRRRHERGDQERHQRRPRQRVHAVPRHVDERQDRERDAEPRVEAGLSPLPVRRQRRRSDRREPRVLLRGVRADAAGHSAGRQYAGALSGARRRVPDSRAREPLHRQDDRRSARRALCGGSLWLRRQLDAERRGAARGAFQLVDEHQHVPLAQRQRQLAVRRHEAERADLPSLDVRQRDPRQHDAAGADLPQRRDGRRERVGAADDGADEVAAAR
ncbi:MAG: hypothetical protein DMF87_04350 [Acidobacteria bacterium]|nr:MAG: hypothetical protein DMF87_04350 [Acidobacteriota bacterium]